jgi:hypothetical protein
MRAKLATFTCHFEPLFGEKSLPCPSTVFGQHKTPMAAAWRFRCAVYFASLKTAVS